MILVKYTRKDNLFSGSINGVHFTEIKADKLVSLLHGIVGAGEDRNVVWETAGARADMPAEDVELLLKDPLSIVRQMNPPPVKIDMSGKKSSLVVGYTTLAHGFGEKVYCRQRGESVECPGCGKWRLVACNQCGLNVDFEEHGEWASVFVKDLLASNKVKFFLPRGWNKGRPWVTRAELEDKYQSFLKEMSNV
jgi:hypothetical protein